MALEAVVYPQGHFSYGCKEPAPYTLPWCGGDAAVGGFGEWDPLFASLVQNVEEWEADCNCKASSEAPPPPPVQAEGKARRKRRRAKVVKNKEEIESQRMTHIAVERNRRRQMNEYLAVLRSLMPPSYAHRGDQASIVGGAINYVRELEQLLQSLEVQKGQKNDGVATDGAGKSPFAGFFSFPQYSASAASHGGGDINAGPRMIKTETPAVADIEASVVEGHANLKVQVPRRPRPLLKLVAGLQQLGLTTLHLNMTTADAMVMYSFSLKVEDECKIGSVEEIAAAVHEILGRQALVDAKTVL